MAPCNYPEEYNGPLTLYGAGRLGELATQYLNDTSQKLVMVLDKEVSGENIRHPNNVHKVAKKIAHVAVSVVNSPYVPIEAELLDAGYRHVIPFYDFAEVQKADYPLANGWFAPIIIGSEYKATASVLEGWSDNISRAHHLQFLAWRRMREEWVFHEAPVNSTNRYFIPEVVEVLLPNETFVDGGAHHGTVISEFVRQVKGQYKKIVAIEPDPINLALLHEAHAGTADLETHLVALAGEDGEAPFYTGLGHLSQFWEHRKEQVAVRSIDSLRLKPSFLKLHLEGHELNALRGAKATLLAHRPIIAVSVYHNTDGICRTPLWLMETLADYKFYFRLHSWCGTGAVVYAIPDGRRRYEGRIKATH